MPKGVYQRKPRQPKLSATEPYSVTLETSGNKYEINGATILDALNEIPLEWQQIKAKGVVTVTQGERRHEHLFYTHQLRKLFVNKLTRMMWAKRLELLMQ